ncbi:peroxisome assembly protein 12-A [Phymastichus coffea]|uniref:peroxisome assembly protein 12-A n=1 Tax=Phymastichus coffea TaxID=108790 RepID=UPI00273B92D1|nr:peroxisome assembly protein 12-A [Phymastichus coffea]
MAERGAHLTGTVFAKPSIFEIAAHKSLAATLEPAIKKIITFCASVNPDKYTWLYQWSDEIYLILVAILQNYYLKNYSASFSETFYGLKRIVLRNSERQLNLDNRRRYLSLVILTAFPYLQRKIENLDTQINDPNAPQQSKWKCCIVQGFKIIRAIKEILTFYQYLLYLSNRSKYPTLSLWLLSISLTYANNDEEIGLTELLKKLGSRNFNASDGLEVLRLSVVRSIEVSAFFLQFLQWWNQEHNYNFNFTTLPIPPPPQIPEFAKPYKGICPICKRPPRIHTAVSTSGFVYCYQCILGEVRRNGKCPVTGYPVNDDNLIRLYIQ